MIQEGAEFARTKVIPYNENIADTNKGRIDNNSYDKDNETNYINFRHAKINSELVDYYKGLIALRKKYAAFRRAKYNDVVFLNTKNDTFALGYHLNYKDEHFLVLFNADRTKTESFNLPKGEWEILADKDNAGIEPFGNVSDKVDILPSTGMVLKRK